MTRERDRGRSPYGRVHARRAPVAALLLCACLAATAPRAEEGPDGRGRAVDLAVQRGLAYLARVQQPDGSFGASQRGPTAVSSLAVMAFLAAGFTPGTGPYGEVINRGVDFVLSTQDERGDMMGPGGGQMYGHNIATLMLGEVSGMLDPERQQRTRTALARALRLTLDAQAVPKDPRMAGGWRYTPASKDSDLSHSGWALMALRSARNNGAPVPREAIDRAMEFVMRCRNEDGGFGYQPGGGSGLARTGAGLLCMELAGRHREPHAFKAGAFIARAFPKAQANELNHYAFYYAAQGMYQLGADEWERFAPLLDQALIARQRPDGSWMPTEGNEIAAGPAYGTGMAILALCVEYAQLPIYQR